MEILLDNKGDTMAEAKSKSTKTQFSKYKITKDNGKVIFKAKEFMGDTKLKRLKAKGWKVEEV